MEYVLNKYECYECQHKWAEVHEAEPCSECPECDARHVEPYDSEPVAL